MKLPTEVFTAFQAAGENDFYGVNPIRPERVFEQPKISANEVAEVLHYKETTLSTGDTVAAIAVMRLKSGKFLSLVVQRLPGINASAATWRVADDYSTIVWYGLHPANRTSLGLDTNLR